MTVVVIVTAMALLMAFCCRLFRTKCRAEGVTVDGEPWIEVSSLDASGPTDPHFVLDRTTGTLTFGDGERGAGIPAVGACGRSGSAAVGCWVVGLYTATEGRCMRFVEAWFVISILLGSCGSGVGQHKIDAVRDLR